MKRLISIIMCAVIATAFAPRTFAAQSTAPADTAAQYEEEIFVLSALGILQGYDDGTYRLNEPLTRAQFAVMTLRLLGIDELEESTPSFADMTDHWAAGYAAMAAGLGLMQGYPDGCFYPDKNVTFNEAVKITVCALGYYIEAQKQGYPAGYLAVASKKSLIDGVFSYGEEEITRADAIKMLYNALDVHVLEKLYGGKEEYSVAGSTLLEAALARLNLQYMRGTLQGAEESTLSGASLRENAAVIDGVTYNCNLTEIYDYIGCPVLFFLTDDTSPEITALMPERGRFRETVIDARDITSVSDAQIITRENGKQKSYALQSPLGIVYNGFCAHSTTLKALNITSGTLRLIDNDLDGTYDVAAVSAQKAFTIKSIEPEYRMVYFKDRLLFGKAFIRLDDEEIDMRYKILDPDGELINLDGLKENMDISVAASTDFRRIRVTVLKNNTVTAALTAVGDDGEIELDGTPYTLSEEAAGIYSVAAADLKLGVSRTWHTDADGRVFSFDAENTADGTYAYILKAAPGKGLSQTLELKLLIGGTYTEIEDETSTEEELEDRMIQQLRNEGIVYMKTTNKIKIDDYRYTAAEAAAVLTEGTVIKFFTNEDGAVNKAETAVLWGETGITERTYVKKHNLFECDGGGAFTIDKNTAILNIPKEDAAYGIYMIDSDCYVKTTLKDATEYTAQAFDYNEDTKSAAAVVIRQDMSSEAAPEITTATPPALVTRVWGRTNEDGDTVNVITALRYGVLKDFECRSEVDLSNIKKGDVVRFTSDGLERVAKIELAQRLERALVPYHKNAGGMDEVMYGYVQSVELDTITANSSTMESIITLSLDGNGAGERTFSVASRKAQPPVYVYNLDYGTGYVGTFKNLRSVDMSDMQNANMALIYASSSEVKAIIIVN